MPDYASDALSIVDSEMPSPLPDDLLRLYALLVLVKGVNTTLEDVHDAWAIWRQTTNASHRSLVPFDQLTQEVQELDRPYVEAIHRAAARIYHPTPAALDTLNAPEKAAQSHRDGRTPQTQGAIEGQEARGAQGAAQ